jgi:hypothetical protein
VISNKKNSNYSKKIPDFCLLVSLLLIEGRVTTPITNFVFLEKCMQLTQYEIKQIEKAADALKKWADNQSYNPPPATKVELTPSWCYKKVIMLLLGKANIGSKVEKDFAALDKLHEEYESWRSKSITEDNEEEFTILVDSLKGALYDLADTLWQIAQSAREELVSEKPAETEQNAIPMRRRIWICLKKIPRWIYYLLASFAALLTILHLSGWLEPIKTFIRELVG